MYLKRKNGYQKIYERILEIGYENPGESYVFKNFIEDLKREFPDNDLDNDKYLLYWFAYHFKGEGAYDPAVLLGHSLSDLIKENSTMRYSHLKIKAFFSANAYYSYIEKIELEQAHIASLKAQNDAKKAIWIAAIAFISATLLQILGFFICC